MWRKITAFSMLAAVVGCRSTGRQESGWTGSERDSAGVAVVENPSQGTWTDATRWRLDEDLRIGTAAGDSAQEFGTIDGLGVGANGRILVLDTQADRPVRVFDRDGGFVTATGGRGSGPGEFRGGAGPVLPAGDGLFLIPDGAAGRAHVFGGDGGFQRTIQVDVGESIHRWGALSQGIPLLQVGRSAMPGMQQNDDLVDVLLAVGSDGASRDTVLTLPSGRQFLFAGGMPELTFFAPEPWWVVGSDDAVWVGVNDRYQIGTYRNDSLRRLVSRADQPITVSQRDRDIILDRWIEIFSGQMPNADAALRQLARFADVFPAYQQFAVSPDGTLWVQQVQVPSQLTAEELSDVDVTKGWGSRTWDVFSPAGRYLGAVMFPRRFEAMSFRDDHVYGVGRDEMDVPYVVRLRIVRP